MSETRGSNKGSVNLDAALREWPHAEKPQADWDDRAQSVMDRVRRGERGASAAYVADENLLEGPLGQTSEDSHNTVPSGGSPVTHPLKREGTPMTMSADRERDRRSLQDLAKMAHGLTPPPSSVAPVPSGIQRAVETPHDKADDSGIVDLAAASTADPAAAIRAQSTPLASQGLFDDEPSHSQRPAPLSHAPVTAPLGAHAQAMPSVPPPALASVAPASPAPQPAVAPSVPPTGYAATSSAVHAIPPEKKKGGAVIALVIGGVVALGAAAAGGLFVMKARQNAEATTAAAVATTEPAAVAQAQPQPAEAEPTPAEPVAAAEPTPEPEAEAEATPATTTAIRGKVAARTTAKGGAAAKHDTAPAKAEGPAKMTEKDLAAAASGPAGDLGAAMKKEVGDDAPKTPAAATTAHTPTGNVPQKPSQGAVTGALGAVLPGARACLGPDDPISRASIVFSSAGTAQSVNVTGGAAGKPAEACIKGALMKAKVQPFAEPTYTANVTVRHN